MKNSVLLFVYTKYS